LNPWALKGSEKLEGGSGDTMYLELPGTKLIQVGENELHP
jgi:hypothetical protein